MFTTVVAGAAFASSTGLGSASGLHLLPRPSIVTVHAHCPGFAPHGGVTVAVATDPGAEEILDERFRALGIPLVREAAVNDPVNIRVRIEPGPEQSYRLSVGSGGIEIRAADAAGAFYAFASLSQLARKTSDGVIFPCLDIADTPAMRWRILSDDVSRGPLPSMRYFKERIRTIAAFKMNGYSPYMEHVFVDPKHPLPAPLDGITPRELAELDAYARRFHVAFIPDQQTFAHMHNTLRWERYAPAAELPHGFLLSPADPHGQRYVRDLIADEFTAVPHPPFFHIGSDEPLDLGRGLSKTLMEREGEGPLYVRHVVDTAKYVSEKFGARPLIWDDALSRHPELFTLLPKSLVFVNWHYGAEKTFVPYIKRIADGGLEQMVAPSVGNADELYPDLNISLANINRFVSDGKAAHVLGMFETVWHDDGETLFEATWYPLLFGAASAWEEHPVDRARFAADFPWTFFGVDDKRYSGDIADLAQARRLLHAGSDRAFWRDAFAPNFLTGELAEVNFSAIRLAAEGAIEHLRTAAFAPMHENVAKVMHLAARRYDVLGRDAQIAVEARGYYDDARAHADGKHDDIVYRDLFTAKYLLWEQRDMFLELEPLVRSAWEYEDRPSHELSVLERYHMAAQRAIERADAIDRATYEGYRHFGTLPPFDQVL